MICYGNLQIPPTIRKITCYNAHVSIAIQQPEMMLATDDLYLNLASTVDEKMKRRELKVIKSAIRGLRMLLYTVGFIFG